MTNTNPVYVWEVKVTAFQQNTSFLFDAFPAKEDVVECLKEEAELAGEAYAFFYEQAIELVSMRGIPCLSQHQVLASHPYGLHHNIQIKKSKLFQLSRLKD